MSITMYYGVLKLFTACFSIKNLLQCVSVCCDVYYKELECNKVFFSIFQYKTLQYISVYKNV